MPRDFQPSQLIELYPVADYFGIDSLQSDNIFYLDYRFANQGDNIWQERRDHDAAVRQIHRNWSADDLNKFFSAARAAYSDNQPFEAPRKCIVRFLKTTYLILGKDPRFIAALEDLPELAVVMVKLLMDS